MSVRAEILQFLRAPRIFALKKKPQVLTPDKMGFGLLPISLDEGFPSFSWGRASLIKSRQCDEECRRCESRNVPRNDVAGYAGVPPEKQTRMPLDPLPIA